MNVMEIKKQDTKVNNERSWVYVICVLVVSTHREIKTRNKDSKKKKRLEKYTCETLSEIISF